MVVPSPLWITDLRRPAEVHTPITETCFVASAGFEPLLVSAVFGTLIAIDCTFIRLSESTPCVAASFSGPTLFNGLRSPRSKIEPRST